MRKMKSHSIIKLSFGAIAFLVVSCSQDDALIDSQVDDNLQTYTLYLDADAPSFETVCEGETRASGNSWEDGDVIYIAFSNGSNTVVSNATYKNNLGAFQLSMTSLSSITDASCRVYYFRGGSVSVSDNTVSMVKYTAIFTDTSAKYSCSSNVITLSAAFKPYTWRLCFKGTAGTLVKLKSASTIIYNTSLNLTSGSFATKAEDANLQVQSGGYTPYVYGQFIGTNNTVKVEVGGSVYSRTIISSKLSIGQSGYYTIPTSSNLNGWTKESGETIEHEYVDLGLPSGTKWATCNIGATKPEEYGGYYAWGETEEKDVYKTLTYKYYDSETGEYIHIGNDIAGTEYDVAYVKWGGSWRMPSMDQIRELIDYCSREWTVQNGVNGTLVTGPNGKSIFLPAAGIRRGDILDVAGKGGYYWLSSPYSRDEYAAWSYKFYSGTGDWTDYTERYLGFTVHAVCP